MPRRGLTALRDGRAWRIGTEDEVAWINDGISPGMSIEAAIPPVFAACATLAFPVGIDVPRDRLNQLEDRFDDSLLLTLSGYTSLQPWWLGFLETGGSDVVFDDAPRVHVYARWPYVLVQAGPDEARNWRSVEGHWHTSLPESMFPADRSWLVSSLWDDAWACVGESDELISALLTEPALFAESTDSSVPDMWPSTLPDEMHDRPKR